MAKTGSTSTILAVLSPSEFLSVNGAWSRSLFHVQKAVAYMSTEAGYVTLNMSGTVMDPILRTQRTSIIIRSWISSSPAPISIWAMVLSGVP